MAKRNMGDFYDDRKAQAYCAIVLASLLAAGLWRESARVGAASSDSAAWGATDPSWSPDGLRARRAGQRRAAARDRCGLRRRAGPAGATPARHDGELGLRLLESQT